MKPVVCPNCGFRLPPKAYDYAGHLRPQLPQILTLLREGKTPYQVVVELKLGYGNRDMISYLRRRYGIVREKSAATNPRNIKMADRYHRGDITYRDLGKLYGVTGTRARDVVIRVEQSTAEQQKYQAIRAALERIEDVPIEAIGLAVRTINGLRNLECVTVGDVLAVSDVTMLRQPNFGRVSVADWYRRLEVLRKEFKERGA